MAPPIKSMKATFCECGNHAFAPIGRGFVTLVSPQDASLLDRKWHTTIDRDGAPRARRGGGRYRVQYLSRVIMSPQAGMVVDHANRDTADNRRENLRECTVSENNANSITRDKPYPKGVREKRGRFEAWITAGRKRTYLGTFPDPATAAGAYKAAAELVFGAFARPE